MKFYIHHYYDVNLLNKFAHNTTNKVFNINKNVGEVKCEYKGHQLEFIFDPIINDNDDGYHILDFFATYFQCKFDEKFTGIRLTPTNQELPVIERFMELIAQKKGWIISILRTEKIINSEGFRLNSFAVIEEKILKLNEHIIITDNFFIDPYLERRYLNVNFVFTNTIFQWNELIGVRWFYEYSNIFSKLNPPYKMGFAIRSHKTNRKLLAKLLVGNTDIYVSQTDQLAGDYGENQPKYERLPDVHLNSMYGETDFDNLHNITLNKIETIDNQRIHTVGLDLFFRVFPMAKIQIMDESWAWTDTNFTSHYLSEKTIGLVLANIPFISTHSYPIYFLQKLLNLKPHPFIQNFQDIQGDAEKISEFIFDFLKDFDKNYQLCKDWTNECHIEFIKRIQSENSFLDLYIKGFKKEEKQYKSLF
jgi:hypothetical protein